MNDVFRTAAQHVSHGWVLGVTTVLFVAVFAFWAWYALRPAHKQMLDDAARLPLNDGGDA